MDAVGFYFNLKDCAIFSLTYENKIEFDFHSTFFSSDGMRTSDSGRGEIHLSIEFILLFCEPKTKFLRILNTDICKRFD